MSKDYGSASYRARIIGTGVILITAKGFTPYANMKARLEQFPWRIYPPHFALFFEASGDFGSAVMTPFVVSLAVEYPTSLPVVNILDANGVNQVPLKEVSIDDSTAIRMADNVAPGFSVYQQVSVPANCIIAPYGAIMPAIFFNATVHLGPLDYATAEAWKNANCGGALL